MRENRLDLVTDMVKERFRLASEQAQKMFKNTNPYRQEKVDPKERVYYYETQFTPEKEQLARQSFGDLIVDIYKADMEKLRRQYGRQ